MASLFRKFRKKNIIKRTEVNVCTMAPNELLKGRTALITGGTGGIGYSIAEAYLNAGASVIITGRTEKRITAAVEQLKTAAGQHAGWVEGIVWDVSQTESLEQKFQEVLERLRQHGHQHLHILVNNAGILGCPLNSGTPEEFDAVISTNLKAVFFLSQQVATHMRDNGIKGNSLNIASSSSLRPATSAYTLSKWGIRGLTMGLAKALIPHGIVVNGVAPGPTSTPMLREDDDSDMTLAANPTGRWGHPVEIANMAVILVSDMSRLIVGDIIYMTGGAGLITQDDINFTF